MGHRVSFAVWASALTLALSVAAPRLALGGPEIDRAVTAALDEASAHFRAARYADALAALQRVEARVGDDPSVRWNIARCLEEMERLEDAITAFERFAQVAKTPEDWRAAEARIAGLRARWTGALVVDCRAGTVSLVEPGDHPPRSCPARFESVEPGLVRGRLMGAAGVVAFEATVRSAETSRIAVHGAAPPATPTGPRHRASGWWPIVAAGASVAVGAGLMWATHSAADDAEDASRRGDRAAYDAAGSRLETLRALGYSAYGLGAALAGVQVWFWTRDTGPAAPERAGVGLSWQGQF